MFVICRPEREFLLPSPGCACLHRQAKPVASSPQGNLIAGNHFEAGSLGWGSYGIWLGSRNGRRPYRDADAGFPFGSSIDDRDFADDNVVARNRFEPPSRRGIRDDGKNNRVEMPVVAR